MTTGPFSETPKQIAGNDQFWPAQAAQVSLGTMMTIGPKRAFSWQSYGRLLVTIRRQLATLVRMAALRRLSVLSARFR